MPTTNDVLDQHLKCFGENDLDGVLADYSSDAVLFIPGRPLQKPQTIRTQPLNGVPSPCGPSGPTLGVCCSLGVPYAEPAAG